MNNIDKQYQALLQDIIDNGVQKGDRTGTGTISVFGRQIRHKMSEGFPLLTTKKMYFKGIVTELLWFLRGDTNIKYLVDNDCNIWNGDAYKNYCKYTSANSSEWNKWMRDNGDGTVSMFTQEEFINKIRTDDEFAKKWGSLGKIYGLQWRKWTNYTGDEINEGSFEMTNEPIDQIQNLINTLKTNPDDRRMIVTAWNPAEVDDVVLPPCHYGFQVWTRELSGLERWSLCKNDVDIDDPLLYSKLDNLNIPKRAISLMWNQRSCDTPLGIPFNVASYGLLLEILGKMVNMVPDELIASLGDAHIYKNQIDGIKEQLTRTPMKLPNLIISDDVNFNGTIDDLLNICNMDSFKLDDYKSHPAIKMPLSN